MIDIQDEKIKLIKHIAALNDAQTLLQIQAFIKELEDDHEDIYTLARTQITPETIDLELLAKEQHYSATSFLNALNNVDHQLFEDQSLEELLNSLSA